MHKIPRSFARKPNRGASPKWPPGEAIVRSLPTETLSAGPKAKDRIRPYCEIAPKRTRTRANIIDKWRTRRCREECFNYAEIMLLAYFYTCLEINFEMSCWSNLNLEICLRKRKKLFTFKNKFSPRDFNR